MVAVPVRVAWLYAGNSTAVSRVLVNAPVITSLLGAGGIGTSDGITLCPSAGTVRDWS